MTNENSLATHRKLNPWQKRIIFCLAIALALLCLPSGAVAQGFSINKIEVNQAIGVQKDGNLKFVAGKPTVVRINLSDQVTVDENNSMVTAKIGDQEVGYLYPKSEKRPVQWVDFICENAENCNGWEAGTYSFEVNVNGVTHTTEAKYIFQDRRTLKILAFPIKARYGQETKQVADDKWKTMQKFMESVFPVSAIKWEIRNEMDLSNKTYRVGNKVLPLDLATKNGTDRSLDPLIQYLQRMRGGDKSKYDMAVGFVAERLGAEGTTQGVADASKGVAIVVAKDEDAPATVAHEVAHLFEVGDTYNDANGASFHCAVNPAPKEFKGMNWDQTSNNINCENGGDKFPTPSDAKYVLAAAKVLAAHHPYEVQGRGLLQNDMACYMGSGAAMKYYWTTPDVYDHLFNQLAPPPLTSQSTTTPERVIDFYGEINAQDMVELGDWEAFTTTTATVDNTTGQYQVVGLDTNGATVVSQAFDVSFIIRSNPVRTVEWSVFQGTMRFPQEVVKFQVKKDTQVLAEKTVSANAPVVSNVTPTVSTTLSGEYTITWAAADGDNDEMYYTVLYNPNVKDPENWWILMDGLTNDDGNSWVEYFDELPGGKHAKIRVIANDGVLSGQADSAEFTVPFKKPEVYIEEMDTYSYESGWEVFLEADIYDVQDGTLTDDKIEWRSNVDNKFLGNGSFLVVEDLQVGEHIITVTGTNSAGLSSSDQITITVGNISSLYLEYPVPNDQDMTLSNSYGNVKIKAEFPTDDITQETFFELEALKAPSQAAPSGLVAASAFYLTAYQGAADAEVWDVVDFSAPSGIAVTMELPVGLNGNSLKLYRWDSNASQWKDVAQDCNPTATYDRSVAGKLTVNVCRLGKDEEFALMAPKLSVVPPISILLLND